MEKEWVTEKKWQDILLSEMWENSEIHSFQHGTNEAGDEVVMKIETTFKIEGDPREWTFHWKATKSRPERSMGGNSVWARNREEAFEKASRLEFGNWEINEDTMTDDPIVNASRDENWRSLTS